MSTTTSTTTFTRTNARHLASKITADLRQFRSFYGSPELDHVDALNDELVEMIAGRYVATYEAGFRKNGERVVSQRYTFTAGSGLSDDRAGGIYPGVDIEGANWFTYMTYTAAWSAITDTERNTVRGKHTIDRQPGAEPTDGSGYWETGRTYASGDTSVSRTGFRRP